MEPLKDQKYKILWRGQESGPYSIEELDSMLTTRDISRVHQIFDNGKWILLGDFKDAHEKGKSQLIREEEDRERTVEEQIQHQRELDKIEAHEIQRENKHRRQMELAEKVHNAQGHSNEITGRQQTPAGRDVPASKIIGAILVALVVALVAMALMGMGPLRGVIPQIIGPDAKKLKGQAAAAKILIALASSNNFAVIGSTLEIWAEHGVDAAETMSANLSDTTSNLDGASKFISKMEENREADPELYQATVRFRDIANKVHKLAKNPAGYNLITYTSKAKSLKDEYDERQTELDRAIAMAN